MLKAVIFDMDGVIIDSEPIYYKVNQKLFLQYGLVISEEEYSLFIGISNPDMWAFIKNKYHLSQTVQELVQAQLTANIEYLTDCNEKPIPGVLCLLKSLQTNNIPIGLASSSPEEAINLTLTALNIRNYFHVIASGENMARSKPAPDIFWYVARILKVDPSNCVVIEDSMNGVKAAKAAGMKCIGFQNKNSYQQDLTQADRIVETLEDVDLSMMERICS